MLVWNSINVVRKPKHRLSHSPLAYFASEACVQVIWSHKRTSFQLHMELIRLLRSFCKLDIPASASSKNSTIAPAKTGPLSASFSTTTASLITWWLGNIWTCFCWLKPGNSLVTTYTLYDSTLRIYLHIKAMAYREERSCSCSLSEPLEGQQSIASCKYLALTIWSPTPLLLRLMYHAFRSAAHILSDLNELLTLALSDCSAVVILDDLISMCVL